MSCIWRFGSGTAAGSGNRKLMAFVFKFIDVIDQTIALYLFSHPAYLVFQTMYPPERFMNRFHLPLIVLATLSMAGCSNGLDSYGSLSGDAGGDGTTEQTGDPGDDPVDPGAENESGDDPVDSPTNDACDGEFNPAGQRALLDDRDPSHPLFIFQATTAVTGLADVMEIQSYPGDPYYGPNGPGSWSLDGANFQDCSLCLLIYAGCDDVACDAVYFADEGEVDISSMSGIGSIFEAELVNVVFREVLIDDQTWESTPVVGGDELCLDGLTINAQTVSMY